MKEFKTIFLVQIFRSCIVHRVKKELLQKDFCEGGLKMINLNLFILALKTTWVRTECKWDNILFSTINQGKLFNFGNGYISYIKENVKNKFWKDVCVPCLEHLY